MITGSHSGVADAVKQMNNVGRALIYAFELEHPGELSAGIHGFTDSVTVSVSSGDAGCVCGEFEEHMQKALSEWYDGDGVSKAVPTGSLEDQITQWQEETFPGGTVHAMLHHLEEEVEELIESAHAGVLDPHELADCYILIVGIAHRSGLDLEDITRDKLEINKNRTWGKPDFRGVVKHVRVV